MTYLRRFFLVLLFACAGAATILAWGILQANAAAGVPTTISYQGRLKSSTGAALDGTYDFIFRFYDASTVGTLLATETHNDVTVDDGYFTASLDLDGDIADFASIVYLDIQVKADAATSYDAMSARVAVNATPYSLFTRGIENAAAAPASNLFAGRMYFNTATGKLSTYNGSAWQEVAIAGAESLDAGYNNFSTTAAKVFVDAAQGQTGGLEFESSISGDIIFDLQSTGDFVIQDGGVAFATFSDSGVFSTAGNVIFGDDSGDTVTSNAATWTFANDTTVALTGGVNGLNFDSNTLSIDAANNRVGIGTAAPTSNLSIIGVAGGGSYATRNIAQNITLGTGLYDVGLRITKGGLNSYSGLDIDILEGAEGGKAMRFFRHTPSLGRHLTTYFDVSGALYNRASVIVSGTYTNSGVNDGEDTYITPPSSDAIMLGVWADVIGAVQARAGNVTNSWVWEGLDRNGNKTSAIQEDGSYWLGATTTHIGMDVGIKRVSAGVLEINTTTAGAYADLKLSDLIASGTVAIGTTSAGAQLDVSPTITATSDLKGTLSGLVYNGASAMTNYYGHYIAAPTGSGTITNTYALVTESGAGNVGIGTTSPTRILGLGGLVARNIGMERGTVSNTAGFDLTINAGGATTSATDKAGGNLVLSSGISTGTGGSEIQFWTAPVGSTGTSDNSLTQKMVIDKAGNVGLGTATPTNRLSFSSTAAQKIWIENSATDVVGRALTLAAGGTIEGTGTSDVAGGNLIFQSGLGTGTGESTISFQTGTTLTTGTTLQSMSTKMTILGDGKVGIGTAAPIGTLSLVNGGKSYFGNVDLSGIWNFYNGAAAVAHMAIQTNGTTNGGSFISVNGGTTTGTANGVQISASSTGQLKYYLQQNGNGAAIYDALVLGTGDALSRYGINGGTTWATGLDNSDSDSFKIAGSGDLGTTDRLTITTSGNVGIATAAPLLKLDVAGSMRMTGAATSVLTGSIDAIASTTVTGVSTLFTTELVVGDRITVSGETRTVTAIASVTSLTVDTAFTDTVNDTSPDKLAAVLIGRDSSNVVKFAVNDLGITGVNMNALVTTNGLCHSGTNVDVATDTLRDIVACSGAPADYAEWYDTEADVGFGDVVALTDATITYTTTESDPFTGEILPGNVTKTLPILGKATAASGSRTFGVISTSPIQVIGSDVKTQGQHPMPVALSGRVPLHVTAENGPIVPGDTLTPSALTPGYAMKANAGDIVIASALDAWAAGTGSIQVFIRYTAAQAMGSSLAGLTFDAAVPSAENLGAEVQGNTTTLDVHEALTFTTVATFGAGIRVDTIGSLGGMLALVGNVYFHGHVYLSEDTAGFALIHAGDTEVHVSFAAPYETQPVVNVGVTFDVQDEMTARELQEVIDMRDAYLAGDMRFVVGLKDTRGFTIILSEAARVDALFNWTAFAVHDAAITESVHTEPNAASPEETPAVSEIDVAAPVSANETIASPVQETFSPSADDFVPVQEIEPSVPVLDVQPAPEIISPQAADTVPPDEAQPLPVIDVSVPQEAVATS